MRAARPKVFHDVNFRMRNYARRHLLDGFVSPPKGHGSKLEFSVDMSGEMLSQQSWQGAFFAKADALRLPEWQSTLGISGFNIQDGKTSFSLWGDFSNGQIRQLDGQVNLDEARVHLEQLQNNISLQHLESLFSVKREGNDWRINVDRLKIADKGHAWPDNKLSVLISSGKQDASRDLSFSAKVIPATEVMAWLKDNNLLARPELSLLAGIDPGGKLNDVYFSSALDYHAGAPFELSAGLERFSAKPYGKIPGVEGLSATLRMNRDGGTLALDSGNTLLSFGTLFRDPVFLQKLKGDVSWFRRYGEWHINTEKLRAENADIESTSRVRLVVPENVRATTMDLATDFSTGNAWRKSAYLPTGIMSKGLVKWLDDSILAGKVEHGKAVYSGRLSEFPYARRNGRLLVEFDATDVDLRFQPDWPSIMQADIHAEITGQGLDIAINSGQIQNNRITEGHVSIPEFREAVLKVEARATGTTANTIAFLYNSPIASEGRTFLEGMNLSGQAQANLSLQMPVSSEAKKRHRLKYEGEVILTESAFHLFDGKINATNISGKIQYTDRGQRSDDLTGNLFGYPVNLKVFTRNLGKQAVTNITAQGKAPVSILAERLALNGFESSTANLDWQGVYSFAYTNGKTTVPANLTVSTGILKDQMALPEPLKTTEKKPITVTFGLDLPSDDLPVMQLNFDDRISSIWKLDTANDGVRLDRGQIYFSQRARLPENPVIEIRGKPGQLDLRRWLSMIIPEKPAKKIPRKNHVPIPIRVDVDDLEILVGKADNRETGKVTLEATDIPPIHGEIRGFIFDKMKLGTVRVRTTRHHDGLQIEEVGLKSDVLDAIVTGR